MRTFTIRRGQYSGEHKIYDSIEEANKDGIKSIKQPWHNHIVEAGDWVVSDDGYVIQCLKRRQLTNKRHRSGQYTDTFRFANGTFYVYYDKEGMKHIYNNFYAVAARSHKSSLGNTSKLGRYMTTKKKLFVTLIGEGVDPFIAYSKAYSKGYSTNVYIQVNKLLEDPLVKEQLMQELKPFVDEVEQKIREKTGHNNLSDYLAEQVANLLAESDLTIKDRRENLKLAIALFGEQLGITKPKIKSRDIQEVEYEEIPPPLLGNNQKGV